MDYNQKKIFKDYDENVIASSTNLEGVITYASKAFCNISGYTKDELLGEKHNIVRHPDVPKEIFEDLWRTIQSGKEWRGEIKNLKKDGGFYWVDTKVTPVFDDNGVIVSYNAIRHNITTKKQLQDQQALIEILFNAQEQIIVVTDGKAIKHINNSFLNFFNIDNLSDFTKDYDCICELFTNEKSDEYLMPEINGDVWVDHIVNNPDRTHKAMIKLKDENYIFSVTASTVRYNNEDLKLTVFTDITHSENIFFDLKKSNKELEKISVTDKLTGIFNRVKLDQVLQNQFNLSKRYGNPFSLMLIDIDHFKNINDTYGHQVGDMVLQRVSTLFRRSIRSTDIVGRWGGEEFMVLCPQTNINQCNIFAQNLRAKIENYNFPNIKNQTASFGLSTYKEGYSLEELIKQADDALYKSKRNGRNQVSF